MTVRPPRSSTFVLVHGAFHGGWCWRRLADRLVEAGARVFCPTMTGLGERSHLLGPYVTHRTFVNDIIGVFEAEELDDVVLAGHSFGGSVISGVVDRIPGRIRHLVYLDAIVPVSGQSALSRLPPETQAARIQAARDSSGGLTIPTPQAENFDVPVGPDRDWVARRLTPHPLAGYTDPVTLDAPVGNGRPCTYIRCTDPIYEAVRPSYDQVKAAGGWTMIDLATGHDAMITAPGPLSNILLRLAES